MKGILLFLFALGACSPVSAQSKSPSTCATALSDPRKGDLVRYVFSKYKLPSSVSLALTKDDPVAGTCYRELTFEGKNPVKTWQLTLYLSPDQRFLTTQVFDTTVDPIEEERQKN